MVLLIPGHAQFVGYIGITLSVRPYLDIPLPKLLLMKRYIVVVYNLRMCMKEDNLSPNYLKGDN